MHFFITAKKICHTRIRPTQSSEKSFFYGFFKICDKGTR